MTPHEERRHQRDVGGALLVGAVVLALLLAATVLGLGGPAAP